jgi:hypothetical protein
MRRDVSSFTYVLVYRRTHTHTHKRLSRADLTCPPVGVTYVDYENDQKRYPKKSAKSLKPLFDSLIKKD